MAIVSKTGASLVEWKPDKSIQHALALLTETELNSLKAYVIRRESESGVEKAGSNMPTRAELILMTQKAAAEGEAEAKKRIKDMKEA